MIWLVLLAGLQSAWAFSFYGPPEAWQTAVYGFADLTEVFYPSGDVWVSQLANTADAPKNLGEEFRWSAPVLYYAYDQSFLNYFGSNGVAAVDAAVAILNRLTNVSSYSTDLSEFPLEELRYNYTASAMHLYDLKSAALEVLVERLGLADPERWAWCVANRALPAGSACPNYDVEVIQRNFDPVTLAPSGYVNGNFFSYYIHEGCPPPAYIVDLTAAQAVSTDPYVNHFSAVASPKITSLTRGIAYYGAFHTALTRDDIGGLRYLYRASNVNMETAPPGSLLLQTNLNDNELLVSSNLTLLAFQALTNNAATLMALYPGLFISSTSNYYATVVTTNVISYYTNLPWSPAGSAATLVTASVRVTNIMQLYSHTFANVVTNHWYTSGLVTTVTTNIGASACGAMAPAGSICTNVTSSSVFTTSFWGDFFIVPTNWCGFKIASLLTTTTLSLTNTIAATNAVAVTNVNGQQYSQTTIIWGTNYAYVVHPVICVPSAVALRQGLERISFVRRDYDSLLGTYWAPVTNSYKATAITNYTATAQTFQRTVTQPDIIFTAADLPVAISPIQLIIKSAPNFNTLDTPAGQFGPGTVESPNVFSFNKVGTVYLNSETYFSDGAGGIGYFTWGSFDGSTNVPVVYPTGDSIYNMESQVFMQVRTTTLPAGQVGVAYPPQSLVGSGGTPPYQWAMSPVSQSSLPPGLGLSAGGVLSGTPTTAGTFSFVVRMTDATAQYMDGLVTLTINP